MVQAVPNSGLTPTGELLPYVRPRGSQLAPLEERMAAALSELRKVAPNYQANFMLTERNLDLVSDLIAKHKLPPPPVPAALQQARAELSELRQKYHALWMGIQQTRVSVTQIHKWLLSSDELADVSKPLPPMIDVRGSQDGSDETIDQVRARYDALMPQYRVIERQYKAISSARGISNLPEGDLHKLLIEKIFERLEVLEAENKQLKATTAKLEDKASSLQTRLPKLEKWKLQSRVSGR